MHYEVMDIVEIIGFGLNNMYSIVVKECRNQHLIFDGQTNVDFINKNSNFYKLITSVFREDDAT